MLKILTFLEKIERFILVLALLTVPVIFSPRILYSFETPKLLVLELAVLLIIFFCLIKILIQGSLTFSFSNLDIPVLLLTISYPLFAILKTPNKTEAFFLPGTAALILTAGLIFFLANSLFSARKKVLTGAIFISGVLASLVSLLATSGALAKIPLLPAYLKSTAFTTFGGKLPESIFLIATLPLGIAFLLEEKQAIKKVFWGVCLAFVGLNIALAIYKMLPGRTAFPTLLPLATSWSVAVDALKDSPLVGVGPGNYLTAFNRFRPLSYNLTNLWAFKFNTSGSLFLTALTETGLIGFAVLLFVLFRLYKAFKKDAVFVSLGLLALSFILFPFYATSLFAFFTLLATGATKKESVVNLKMPNESPVAARIPAILVAVVGLAVIGAAGFFIAKSVFAEYKFSQAVEAIANNNGRGAFENISQAIRLNRNVDRYRVTLAQLDIAAASSIARKKDLTDQDKTNITQLIQQAIQEGKNTVFLNPQRAGNWENLANIYRSIMPFAQGADNFAIQTLGQAVALDPINPNLRISLGGVYFALGRYDDAASSFQLATLAKPDLANAHYNLAAAFREKGETQKAIDELNKTLALVQKDSTDYKTVTGEISDLEKKLPPKPTGEQTGSLTAPKPAEKPVVKPPLKLPEEATPPTTP